MPPQPFPYLALLLGVTVHALLTPPASGALPPSQDEPICFIQLANGQQLDLTALCAQTPPRRLPRPLNSFYDSPLKLEDMEPTSAGDPASSRGPVPTNQP